MLSVYLSSKVITFKRLHTLQIWSTKSTKNAIISDNIN